uniref:Uncharacterized 7.3 kDa protein in petA 5'region n=1 Tax=Chlamydomonas reinhardtii TaxID=3055 RepID=YCX4_CHLRE|nr:RecName: Full=Uncharacterized 7.3 kDa protein in petA 5'region; AltName: Full=ORF62 [Chlamydomonas reinhardtii]BAA00843.1 unnamed protein product [Chlamydomonas reinhardtii]
MGRGLSTKKFYFKIGVQLKSNWNPLIDKLISILKLNSFYSSFVLRLIKLCLTKYLLLYAQQH